MGLGLVLYANAALQAALKAALEVLGALKRDGRLDGARGRLASLDGATRAVAKPRWDSLEQRFKLS